MNARAPKCNTDRLRSARRWMRGCSVGLVVWLTCIFLLVGLSFAFGHGTTATRTMFACWVAVGVLLLLGLFVSFARYRAAFEVRPVWYAMMLLELAVLAPVHILLACAGGGFRPSLVRTADNKLSEVASHYGLERPAPSLHSGPMMAFCDAVRDAQAAAASSGGSPTPSGDVAPEQKTSEYHPNTT